MPVSRHLGAASGRAQPETLLRAGDVEIDLLTRCVKRGEKQLELQPREFRLLEFLVRNVGKVLDRPTLLEKVCRDCHFDPSNQRGGELSLPAARQHRPRLG